jgi:hypothetical protein
VGFPTRPLFLLNELRGGGGFPRATSRNYFNMIGGGGFPSEPLGREREEGEKKP